MKSRRRCWLKEVRGVSMGERRLGERRWAKMQRKKYEDGQRDGEREH